jgi:hypothetical protein
MNKAKEGRHSLAITQHMQWPLNFSGLRFFGHQSWARQFFHLCSTYHLSAEKAPDTLEYQEIFS